MVVSGLKFHWRETLGTLTALFCLGVPLPSQAVNVLVTAQHNFFDANSAPQTSVSFDLSDGNSESVAKKLAQTYSGTVIRIGEGSNSSQRVLLPNGQTIDVTPLRSGVSISTSPGTVAQVESLLQSFSAAPDGSSQPLFGGKISRPEVGLSVSLEAGKGKTGARVVTDLLRSYYRPEHWQMIRKFSAAQGERLPTTPPLSPGFMARLLDPTYEPTLEELYRDYAYRQPLEALGEKDAWTLPFQRVRRVYLEKVGENPIPEKGAIALHDFFSAAFPSDPLSSKISSGSGGKPTIRFRLPKSVEGLKANLRQAVGLYQGAESFGYYDHDKLLSAFSNIPESTIQELRTKSNRSLRTGKPLVVKNFFGDPAKVDFKEYKEVMPLYKGLVIPVFPEEPVGRMPVVIPGESVVWHRWADHHGNMLGRYNPGAVNPVLQSTMENKFLDFAVWDHFAPGSQPKTILLSHISDGKELEPEKLVKLLNETFPKGWVLKGNFDSATVGNLVTDKTDLVSVLKSYQTGDYNDYAKSVREKFAGLDPDEMMYELTQHKDYFGFKIAEALKDPDNSLVQSKVDIDREFRVEIVGGKVLGGGSTVDRWAFMTEGATPSPAHIVKAVEEWTQAQVDKLPKELRGTPFGMDVALLKDGSFIMIESNAGGNSGFLVDHPETVGPFHEFLSDFPQAVRKGEVITEGKSTPETLALLREIFQKYKINPAKSFEGFEGLESGDRFAGVYDHVEVKPEAYTIGSVRVGQGKICADYLRDLMNQ